MLSDVYVRYDSSGKQDSKIASRCGFAERERRSRERRASEKREKLETLKNQIQRQDRDGASDAASEVTAADLYAFFAQALGDNWWRAVDYYTFTPAVFLEKHDIYKNQFRYALRTIVFRRVKSFYAKFSRIA